MSYNRDLESRLRQTRNLRLCFLEKLLIFY